MRRPSSAWNNCSAIAPTCAAALAGRADSGHWPAVFPSLAEAVSGHSLPGHWLHALLDAFEQDVRNPRYVDRAALLEYCARSANPVGRLLLHLMRVGDDLSLQQSDAICSALQLINFWQDLSVDLPRQRNYVPLATRSATASMRRPCCGARTRPPRERLVRDLVCWSRTLMDDGAPLALRVPGRFGWELRLVVQGGYRILEKIVAMDHASLQTRPVLRRADAPRLLWRAGRMRR